MIRTERAAPGSNTLRDWASELDAIDEQIEALQTSKKDFYGVIRDEHGKVTANALKAAIKLRRMDAEKRATAEQIDAETARILTILEGEPRAPRATRVEKIEEFPPHDPETGEITQTQELAQPHSPAVASAPAGSASVEIPAPHSDSPESLSTPRATTGSVPPPSDPVPNSSVTSVGVVADGVESANLDFGKNASAGAVNAVPVAPAGDPSFAAHITASPDDWPDVPQFLDRRGKPQPREWETA